MLKRMITGLVFISLCGLVSAEVAVGDKAPAIKAVDQDGNPWLLKNHLGGKYLVLYFYPAAMTGGCTKQACSYRDHIESTSDSKFNVVGISGDSPESLRYFKQAEGLNFTLLSDPDGSVATAYGVSVRAGEKSITRTVDDKVVSLSRSNTTARVTFVVDPKGTVVYRDSKVKAIQDLENVLKFLDGK